MDLTIGIIIALVLYYAYKSVKDAKEIEQEDETQEAKIIREEADK